MSKSIIILLCLALLALAVNVSAQPVRYGIGINVMDFFKTYEVQRLLDEDFYDLLKYPVLYGTVLMPRLRIEPGFNVWRYSRDYTSPEGGYQSNSKTLISYFGLGVSGIFKRTPKNLSYAGIKLGIEMLSSKSETTSTDTEKSESTSKKTDVKLGPCLGTEYFLTESLSLGGEFQIIYTFLGQERESENGQESESKGDESSSTMRSNGLIYLRWYF